MKSLTSARGFTTRATADSWQLFESGAVPQSTHLLTHAQAIADLTLPVYAPAGDWGNGGPPVPWQVGQWCLGSTGWRGRTGTIHETHLSRSYGKPSLFAAISRKTLDGLSKLVQRSEERRVGKERRPLSSPY